MATATTPTSARTARAAATATAALWSSLLQRSNEARRLFLVFDGDAPSLRGSLAVRRRSGSQGRAIAGLFAGRAASLDSLDDVEGLVRANDDVVAAGIDGIAGFYGNPAVALTAQYLDATDNSPAVQEAIVQTAFGQPVGLLVVEVGFGEQLARKIASAV